MTKIREIEAKTLLSHSSKPDTYFGLKYNMNLYRGCQHRCIYCDSRSECYQIEDFDGEVLVKTNAIELLRKELASKRVKGVIGLGSMNDPFMPIERKYRLAGQALEIIAEFGFPIHIITKSDHILDELETIKRIARVYATVSFTVTTADDDLATKVEPLAPRPSRRLAAMRVLADNGIQTGVTMMPILPFIEDTEENIRGVVAAAADAGATYILGWMGMTLRNRQRDYYYRELDRHFPGVREKYREVYRDRYEAESPWSKKLYALFGNLCQQYGLKTKLPLWAPQHTEQLSLFG